VNGDLGGVFIATVKESKLDGQGRIAIEIPSRSISCLARLIAPMAGKDRGLVFLPDQGDQVVVSFVNGAPGEPLIIGSLWSTTAKPPPTDTSGKNHVKIIKTKSGHSITFTDESGKEKIEIVDSNKSRLVFDSANKTIEITASDGVSIKSKKITIDGDLHVTGKSNLDKQVEIGTTSKTTIDGNQIKGQ
jgi:uncharacterized protein involved in type VI secretion and phage assembly